MPAVYRVLAVGGDAETIDILRRQLDAPDFELVCVSTAAEALDTLARWPADLVVCDDRIDGMSGLDLMSEVRKRYRRARFLILTPPAETPDFMRPGRDQMVAFLGRPFDPDTQARYVRGSLGLDEHFANRRAHTRYPFTMEARLVTINPFDDTESRPIPTLVRDVSRSGMSMIVRQVLPVPTMLKVALEVPPQQYPFQVLAKSISCTLTQIPGVYRLGIKFVGLLPTELEAMLLQHGGNGDRGGSTDIFLGKSFKTAVREWVAQHQYDVLAELNGDGRPLEEIADELARDASEPQPPRPILTTKSRNAT